jgi:hypothetical protein
MKTFYAIVHKDGDGAFGVQLPDAPGCFSAADDLADVSRTPPRPCRSTATTPRRPSPPSSKRSTPPPPTTSPPAPSSSPSR